jgi:chorismate mutase/prephenate dehydratase
MVARPEQSDSEGAGGDIAPELAELRASIDAIDTQILARLNERAERVLEVGALKRRTQSPVYVAGRERDLVARLAESNAGPFPCEGIAPVFREIISATRSLEEVVRVSFLGPEGTFSHEAVVRQFGALVELVPADSLREVIALSDRRKAHFGMIPLENSTTGAVTESYDSLVASDVSICGELLLEVSHSLLSRSEDLAAIRKVASHPQPLEQCRAWLQKHLPRVEIVEVGSTAKAAELAASQPDVAAVGNVVSAEAHGLHVLEHGIEDQSGNTTRFVIVGREQAAPTGNDLTSVVFTTRKDQSGALYRLLDPFARYGVNLTSIQSRPIKGKPWEYLFFMDVEGHVSDDAVAKALGEAAEIAQSHKVLGSFPRARPLAAVRVGG